VTARPSSTYPHELAGGEVLPPETAPAALVAAWRAHEAREMADLLEEAGPAPLRAAAGPWRMAGSLQTGLAEADAVNPGRDRASDGGIGNLRHQLNWEKSDHNPWLIVAGQGICRARDFDVDGLDVAGAFERIRLGVLAGRLPQFADGGYLILNASITSPDFRRWNEYHGPNPHVTHGHASVSLEVARFDDRRPWGIWTPPSPTVPLPSPPAPAGRDLRGMAFDLRGEQGATGPRVAALQAFFLRVYPRYARPGLGPAGADGMWGQNTTGVLRSFARNSGVRSADGKNIGPQVARKLYLAGFRG
jgi:hypothetical protein